MRILFVLTALAALAACRTSPLAGPSPRAPLPPADLAMGRDLTPPVDMARCPARFHDDPSPQAVRCGDVFCMLGPGVAGCYRGGGTRCGEGWGGPAIECDGPEDCAAGQVCVLFLGEAIGQDEVACAAGTGHGFCHTDADCADGTACYEDDNDSVYFGGTAGLCRQRCD